MCNKLITALVSQSRCTVFVEILRITTLFNRKRTICEENRCISMHCCVVIVFSAKVDHRTGERG
jgi:hypothetical protein